jgi:hypothetical protein
MPSNISVSISNLHLMYLPARDKKAAEYHDDYKVPIYNREGITEILGRTFVSKWRKQVERIMVLGF